jgi:PTH2 family peptidyl-tRNA hydrolase
MENTKQVIVLRRELGMRRGKEISQGCHASMAFLTKNLQYDGRVGSIGYVSVGEYEIEIDHWLKNSFRKIVCGVKTLEELTTLHQKALDSGLISHIIEDNGATEFNGVKTITALAIGPHFDSKFIGITDHLPLL